MQTHLRDVRFEINKQKGFPKLHDDGLADLRIAGKGMSIVMNIASALPLDQSGGTTGRTLRTASSSTHSKHLLEPQFIRVKIDRLALHMHDTRRDWMYRLLSPFMAARVKRAIERSVRDQIVSSLRSIDALTSGLAGGIYSH